MVSQSVLVNRRSSGSSVLGGSLVAGGGQSSSRFISRTDVLPQTIDLKAIKAKRNDKADTCAICEAGLSKTRLGNKIFHCKRCANAVCGLCSDNQRQLSIADEKKYRVCDECDTMMDNYTIKQNHEEVIQAQSEKIEAMNNNIEELDNKRQKQQEEFEREIKDLED